MVEYSPKILASEKRGTTIRLHCFPWHRTTLYRSVAVLKVVQYCISSALVWVKVWNDRECSSAIQWASLAQRWGTRFSRWISVRFGLGSLFSSKVVLYAHRLVTLSLTIDETITWLTPPFIWMQNNSGGDSVALGIVPLCPYLLRSRSPPVATSPETNLR